ncbi:MAG: hypothetical protein FRX48_07977 [Lasallia pustulata]|uniref:Annexin n=1 Tax=Lasallia pustulata TaxID=136370 RepID=A0A5M8PG45_9LECA|nr:MAG: hypothetical protein FRX48_07977 [Lasallia pustulata]
MLSVNGSRLRGRSKSPGRERSRSRDARAPSPAPVLVSKKTSKKYYDDDDDDDDDEESEVEERSVKYKYAAPKYETAEPHHRASSPDTHHRRASSPDTHQSAVTRNPRDYRESSEAQYERDRHDVRHASYASSDRYEHARPAEYVRQSSYSKTEYASSEKPGHSMPGQYKREYDEDERDERSGRSPPSSRPENARHLSLNSSGSFNVSIGGGHSVQPQYAPPLSPHYAQPQVSRPEGHRTHSGSVSTPTTRPDYAYPERYQYAEPPQQITYTSKSESRHPSYTQTAHAQFVEVAPGGAAIHAPPSPGLSSRMHSLSVSGSGSGALSLAAPGQSHGHNGHGGLPPGSPLLEAYHGTYQSISPMPSPLMLAAEPLDDLSDLETLSPQHVYPRLHSSTELAVSKKRVSIYDPEPDAIALKDTKLGSRDLIEILPHLTNEHILQLRTEYKKHVKVNGKGINIAKHIKLRVPGNLGKIAYATALGRWESEAHWANFWYQSNSSRRELLIESLMGRTNSEIRCIKDGFSDKRYNDSLEKCMQTELKKDKFRNAVLLALEERRMEEGRGVDIDLVKRDVHELYKALTAKEGGETAMIQIVVVRSDSHLREVLRVFEQTYRKNFAREMIKKSQNLVGETLAHILNGVLNRPVRDALLLHQALAETSKDRAELLISRLVRFHWEPRHLERVKTEYKNKYGHRLEKDIMDGTKGEFSEFCVELCATEEIR